MSLQGCKRLNMTINNFKNLYYGGRYLVNDNKKNS